MTPLARRSIILALALALAALGLSPASAQPPSDPARPWLTALDPSTFDVNQVTKLLTNAGDRTVSALVELEAPQALERRRADRSLSPTAARRAVTASQETTVRRLSGLGVRVYGRLSTVLNAVQIRTKASELDRIRRLPGVVKVEESSLVQRSNAAADRFTGVDRAWQDLGRTGRGTTIGIIDSGIDYTHADFGGPGTPAAFTANNGSTIEPGSFPTEKVTGGYDLVGDFYGCADCGFGTVPIPDPDPLDCDGHGTHVAGTAAGAGVTRAGATYTGPYDRAALGQDFAVAPGAAPEASLKAYRVFGCEGGAASDVIVAAIDRAVADGVDVINLSLGFTLGTAHSMQTVAVDAATQAGVLVVAAGGNDGDGAYVSSDPGTADSALSVAAVDAESPTLPGVAISGGASGVGVNLTSADLADGITGAVVDVGRGCDEDAYAASDGKIAIATRGLCPLVDRLRFGQEAGAEAVILVNDEAGYPPYLGPLDNNTLPFVGVEPSVGAALRAAVSPIFVQNSADVSNPSYRATAAFSSSGPRRLDSAPKPDLGAPGVSIPSAASGTGTGAKIESGTSMASPHVAGIAALVKQAHPSWTPIQLKAALMSTASPGEILDSATGRVGVGLVRARAAIDSKAILWTDSGLNALAFGKVELGTDYSETKTFKITNVSSRLMTYDFAAHSTGSGGATISITPRSVVLQPGDTRFVQVRMQVDVAGIAGLPGASSSDRGALQSVRGAIVATPRGDRTAGLLRIGYLLVPVPLSDIRAQSRVQPAADGTYPDIKITNSGPHAGTADLYSWLLSDPPGDCPYVDGADLINVGIQSFPVTGASNDRLLVVAVNFAEATSTRSVHQVAMGFNIQRSDKPDYYLTVIDTGLGTTGSPDSSMTALVTRNDGQNYEIIAARRASAPANGSTLLMGFLASEIEVTPSDPMIEISAVIGVSQIDNSPVTQDSIDGRARFDPFQPVVSQGNFLRLTPGQTSNVPVSVDASQLTRQTANGWLVVSPDDAAGRAEVDRVTLDRAASSQSRASR